MGELQKGALRISVSNVKKMFSYFKLLGNINAVSLMFLDILCSCNCMGRDEKKMDRKCSSEVRQNNEGSNYKVVE